MKTNHNKVAGIVPKHLFSKILDYQKRTQLLLKSKQSDNNRTYLKGNLTTLIPLAASALSPLLSLGQNCGIGNGVTAPDICAPDILLDIDGGGNDFAFAVNGNGLYLRTISGSNIQVINGSTIAGFQYAVGYNPSAVINASGNFTNGGNPATGVICSEATSGTWVLETNYGGGSGDWFNAGGAVITKLVGFKKDNKLGFIEVIWDNANSTLSIGNYGIAETSGLSSIIAGNCTPLPVELMNFEAQRQDGHILLSWETLSELNNNGFELERSLDGEDFQKIAWIEGVGQSQNKINYQYKDPFQTPTALTHYYRLKQIDFDGSFSYSDIIVMEPDIMEGLFLSQLRPNPSIASQTQLWIYSPQVQAIKISIHNMMGTELTMQLNQVLKGEQSIPLILPQLAAAQYYVRIQLADGKVQFKKMIILDE